MADRVAYGLTNSENGWRMVDQGSCVWVLVAGSDNVHLQIREGQPAAIMGAFAADFNAYVERLRDADSACWTNTNDVASSNHLSGTAMDLNWQLHPFRIADAGFDAAKKQTVLELLDFYEGMIFWGNNWQSPKDAMHFQMGYDTYGSANVDKVQQFIARKIRADGLSTFRRSPGTPPPPVVVVPPQTGLTRSEIYAVRIINEGRRRQITPKGIQIALATGIVESNITVYANQKLPKSLALPHDAVGNDGYSVGIFQQQVRDSGSGWWWGDEATCMGVESSAGLFYDRLVKLPYNGTSKTPGAFAQQVQDSDYPDRYDEHWGEAVALYNKLSGMAPPPPPAQGEDELSAAAEQMIADIHRELTQRLVSRSPLRHLGEGPLDTMAGFLLNVDGSQHVEICKILAGYGHPATIALLQEISGADPTRYPDRQDDAKMAQAILAEATNSPPATVVAAAAPSQPQIVYLPAPTPEPVYTPPPAELVAPVPAVVDAPLTPSTTGEVIGRAYDALQELRLADALPIEDRAPLAALIAVLNTKNGSQL